MITPSLPQIPTPTRFSAAEAGLTGSSLRSLPITHPLLERARANAGDVGYSGSVTPREAHELLNTGLARLVDVRTPEERSFVGYVRDSVHVPWSTGIAMHRNPRFVRELESIASRDEVLLFLCRGGGRSAAAATAAQSAGFLSSFNVLEGFEGEPDEDDQRGHLSGWRYHGLPWQQD